MKKYMILVLLFAVTLQINAQNAEKNTTGESISQQLKNNKVPGLQYAPAQSSAPAQVQPHATMVEEIKNGKYGKVLSGGTSAPAPVTTARSANQQLSSDKSASQAAQALQKTQAPPALTIPSQGSISDDAVPPAKAAPVKELKRQPVKKDQQ
ncbi:MAG: hypothetical protein J7527_01320 [Chitinophagaceae bacterium]|nr:hypothetical protein [Chitinophagaceae bacterium]